MQHFSSKEIARTLGVSPHTVDKRLKQAIAVLGVNGRVEAARMLAQSEGDQDQANLIGEISPPAFNFESYDLPAARDQSLVYQSPDLSLFAHIGNSKLSPGEQNPLVGGSNGMLREGQAPYFSGPATHVRAGFLGLVSVKKVQVNDLSVAARMLAMMGIVSGSILAFAVFISVIEGLSRLY
jgi:Bacterial regulatory proteins, luxR family